MDKMVNVRLDDELQRILKYICEKRGLSNSKMIRQLIVKQYINDIYGGGINEYNTCVCTEISKEEDSTGC